jgi:hypothetical protein
MKFNNFKAFGPKMQFFIKKPITLVYGPNSVGKSSLLHSQLYFEYIMKNKKIDFHSSSFSGDNLDLGGFNNFIHKKDANSILNYEIGLPTNTFFRIIDANFTFLKLKEINKIFQKDKRIIKILKDNTKLKNIINEDEVVKFNEELNKIIELIKDYRKNIKMEFEVEKIINYNNEDDPFDIDFILKEIDFYDYIIKTKKMTLSFSVSRKKEPNDIFSDLIFLLDDKKVFTVENINTYNPKLTINQDSRFIKYILKRYQNYIFSDGSSFDKININSETSLNIFFDFSNLLKTSRLECHQSFGEIGIEPFDFISNNKEKKLPQLFVEKENFILDIMTKILYIIPYHLKRYVFNCEGVQYFGPLRYYPERIDSINNDIDNPDKKFWKDLRDDVDNLQKTVNDWLMNKNKMKSNYKVTTHKKLSIDASHLDTLKLDNNELRDFINKIPKQPAHVSLLVSRIMYLLILEIWA